MKKAFFEECGHNADNIGDVSARFSAVASEIYSLYCNMDYSRRQSFLQTAQGEYLDYHAQLRDMQRYEASKAIGTLTFGITEAIDVDISIPKGTICSVKDRPFIQFKTDKGAVLKAGETSVDVPATALESGAGYNVDCYTVTVAVNAPARIETVTNKESFVGGCDKEGDESLRKRLINSFKLLPTGISIEYVEECIRKIDGVIDCKIYGVTPTTGGTVMVYVRTNDNNISSRLFTKIEDRMVLIRLLMLNYRFVVPQRLDADFVVNTNADEDEVAKLCREYVNSHRIGESLDMISFRVWLSKKLNGDVVDISSPQASGAYIVCPNDRYIYPNSIGVINNG